jgi:RND family efflux transporter MFP subunit
MNRVLKIGLPVVVLGASVAIAGLLMLTGPEAERRQPPPTMPTVEVLSVVPTDYQVSVRSRGTVSPRTQSTLVPEVAGQVVEVAPSFRNGGFFEQGDVLLRIDSRDYENAVTVARSELAQAKLRLREEQAQSEQAQRDWERLGGGDEPTDLVLRKPQLASARAAVAAAEARLRQAEIDLERTRIRAPYAGRVLEKEADIGQYVTPGTPLATIYAVDYVEIRLPVTDEQQAFLDLPETYRDQRPDAGKGPAVTLSARIGRETIEWQGRIVRSEGAIDTQSRQLFVVAQVDDPYGRKDGRPPLKVGQFVEAVIEGERLEDVYVLPRGAVEGEDEVFVVDAENRLQRRRLDVIWRDTDYVVAAGGLEPGERRGGQPADGPDHLSRVVGGQRQDPPGGLSHLRA